MATPVLIPMEKMPKKKMAMMVAAYSPANIIVTGSLKLAVHLWLMQVGELLAQLPALGWWQLEARKMSDQQNNTMRGQAIMSK
jgi:hypothetical protein